MSLEKCFNQFRENIVGIYQKIQSSYCEQDLIYKDWIPTGRLYYPEKNKTLHKFSPLEANRYAETATFGHFIYL
jgi:hypothetical protein